MRMINKHFMSEMDQNLLIIVHFRANFIEIAICNRVHSCTDPFKLSLHTNMKSTRHTMKGVILTVGGDIMIESD